MVSFKISSTFRTIKNDRKFPVIVDFRSEVETMPGITIQIVAGESPESSKANATGSLKHFITDEERTTFGIENGDLKRKVGEYFEREPDHAFVRSPTPFGDLTSEDLYQRYGWDQVQTVLIPIETEILSVDSVPTIIFREVLTNESDCKGNFNAKISRQVSNAVSTSWSQNYTVSFNQEISYDVKFLGAGVGGKTSFGFQGQWGKNVTESQTTTLGMETGISVELEPGEEVVTELSANSGKMKVRITYEASLAGDTAVNYNAGFKDHHYWAFSISDVLGSSNNVMVTEDIEIEFYTEAHATIKNLTGETLRRERACCM